jgi:two-component system LytT family response regulator
VIRTLIVDDAPVVRQGIRLLLGKEPDIEVIGEAGDGPQAVTAIKTLQPDLLFLDVQMPGFDGFEVLERAGVAHLCAVIFVTAFDYYAMRAFNADAVSYLLKPITPQRLHHAVERARRLLARPEEMENALTQMAEFIEADGSRSTTHGRQPLQRFVVRHGHRFLFVKSVEVDWISSSGEYSRLHTGKTSFLIRTPISQLEERLDPNLFARIHRSSIVNLDRIQEVRPRTHGDYDVMLRDGTLVRLSRSYRDRVFSAG